MSNIGFWAGKNRARTVGVAFHRTYSIRGSDSFYFSAEQHILDPASDIHGEGRTLAPHPPAYSTPPNRLRIDFGGIGIRPTGDASNNASNDTRRQSAGTRPLRSRRCQYGHNAETGLEEKMSAGSHVGRGGRRWLRGFQCRRWCQGVSGVSPRWLPSSIDSIFILGVPSPLRHRRLPRDPPHRRPPRLVSRLSQPRFPHIIPCWLRNTSSLHHAPTQTPIRAVLRAMQTAVAKSHEEFPCVPVLDSQKGLLPDLLSVLVEKGKFAHKTPLINSTSMIESCLIANYTTSTIPAKELKEVAKKLLQLHSDVACSRLSFQHRERNIQTQQPVQEIHGKTYYLILLAIQTQASDTVI
ncbi:hypothetical protein B0H19DRAFT_1231379 [Mycena capillaripes]|nr:hypothetical protein B0H19DRAFT_1231379 [Mycena capillaripes]